MYITDCKTRGDGYLVNGGLSVPNDPSNRHYQLVQEWLAAGNTPSAEFTQAELDEQASQVLVDQEDEIESAMLKADPQVKALIRAKGPAIENYIDNNVTDLASAKELLKLLAKAISAIGREQFR